MCHTPPNLTNTKTKFAIRAWLGGSFDPIHLGHLDIVRQVHDALRALVASYPANSRPDLHLALLPTAANPLKNSAPTHRAARLQMLRLALADLGSSTSFAPASISVTVDVSELDKTPPVYTIDTVRAWRKAYPCDILIFVMGMDSLMSLPRWHHGFDILNFVHLWVLPRPQTPTHDADHSANSTFDLDSLAPALRERLSTPQALLASTHGKICLEPSVIRPYASTHIRKLLNNADPSAQAYLSPSVYAYIRDQGLYR